MLLFPPQMPENADLHKRFLLHLEHYFSPTHFFLILSESPRANPLVWLFFCIIRVNGCSNICQERLEAESILFVAMTKITEKKSYRIK